MKDIKCPSCGKAFKVDESGYAEILKQVRDSEFDQQLQERLALAEKEKLSALQLAEEKLKTELNKATAQKDSEIQELKAKVDSVKTEKQLAIAEALKSVEKERDSLTNEVDKLKLEMKAASDLATSNLSKEIRETEHKKDAEILALKSELQSKETAQTLALAQAVGAVEKERDELKSNLKHAQLEKTLAEQSLKDKYETQLKDRDEAIERLRDMKAKLSTKMVGETLEQHCEIEFNRIRPTAFPKAYFDKDNDAKSGSKGDYIFKDYSETGTELVSIMFEMKNESDTTATKKKNEDFFK